MTIPDFSIIVAVDQNGGIGKNGSLPWRLAGDLKHFKDITCRTTSPGRHNAVVMGRKTWDSLPSTFRPLPGRVNCVISRNPGLSLPPGVVLADGLPAALARLGEQLGERLGQIFIIGGVSVFQEAISLPACQRIFLTKIQQTFDCDVFFNPDLNSFAPGPQSELFCENGVSYYFCEYQRK